MSVLEFNEFSKGIWQRCSKVTNSCQQRYIFFSCGELNFHGRILELIDALFHLDAHS